MKALKLMCIEKVLKWDSIINNGPHSNKVFTVSCISILGILLFMVISGFK